jgi:hypothetical protein
LSPPFRFSNQNNVHISHPSHVCCMSGPYPPPSFYRPNNIWCIVQVKCLL